MKKIIGNLLFIIGILLIGFSFFLMRDQEAQFFVAKYFDAKNVEIAGVNVGYPSNCIKSKNLEDRAIFTLSCLSSEGRLVLVSGFYPPFNEEADFDRIKKFSEEFSDFDDVIYMKLGRGQGSGSSFYSVYLKSQSIIIASDDQFILNGVANEVKKFSFKMDLSENGRGYPEGLQNPLFVRVVGSALPDVNAHDGKQQGIFNGRHP